MNEIIFYSLNGLAGLSSGGDKAIIFLAEYFGFLVIIAATLFLFRHIEGKPGENAWTAFSRKAREIFFVISVSVVAWVAAWALKGLIGEMRPQAILPNVTELFLPDDKYSFPSGHATFFSALGTAFYFYHRFVSALILSAAVLIGLARVAAGVHFPADILAGLGLGALVAGAVAYFRKKA